MKLIRDGKGGESEGFGFIAMGAGPVFLSKKGGVMERGKSTFVLTGFRQDLGFRVFEFDRAGKAQTRTHHAVRADLTLVRKYGLHIQELPLLCRRLLEASEAPGTSLTLPEADMIACAEKETSRTQAKARRPWQRQSGERGVEERDGGTEKAR